MRCSLNWAICGLLCLQSAVALAQQTNSPIQPNYGRLSTAGLNLPSPEQTLTPIGTGVTLPTSDVKPTVIPQQGSVDLGNSTVLENSALGNAAAAPALPNYSYGGGTPAATTGACTSCGPAAHGGCGKCGSGTCLGSCQHGCHKHNGGWFGGLYYMQLWRADDNLNFGRPLSVSAADPFQPVMFTGQAHAKEMPGLGLRFGKMITPCAAIEFIYWQIFEDDVTAFTNATTVGAGITTPLNFASLTYDPLTGGGPQPVSDFFDDSGYVSVRRSYDYRNFEVNFLRLPFIFGGNPCAKARLALLAGPRYFRADEGLRIFSDDLNEIPGDDPLNELYYQSETENHLVGFQIGTLLDYRLTNRLSVQLGSKAGIYNNRMNHRAVLAGGAGLATVGAGPSAGLPYALNSKKDDVAFLGELDAGGSYCVSNNLRFSGGYKMLGLAGYADPVSQIPVAFDDFGTAGLIYDNDSLILHGFYVGGEFCW